MDMVWDARDRLWQIVIDKSIVVGEAITLSAGTVATYYFDCKKTMLNGEGLALLADVFLDEIARLPEYATAIGGPTLGADPIVAAVAMRTFQIDRPTLDACIVRKGRKRHGTNSYIENELPAGTRIVVVDDVITSGSSIAKACDCFLDHKYKIAGIVALVDREAGGKERLERQYGCAVRSVFKKTDFAVPIKNRRAILD